MYRARACNSSEVSALESMRLLLRLCGSACHQRMAPMLWSASCQSCVCRIWAGHSAFAPGLRSIGGCALGAKEEEDEEEKEEEKKEMSGTMVMVHPVSYGGETFLPCVYDYGCTVHRTQNLTLVARRIIASSRLPARAPRRPWSRRDHDAYLWFETTRCGPATSTFAAMRKCCRTTLRCARWAPTRGSCSTRSRPAARLL